MQVNRIVVLAGAESYRRGSILPPLFNIHDPLYTDTDPKPLGFLDFARFFGFLLRFSIHDPIYTDTDPKPLGFCQIFLDFC